MPKLTAIVLSTGGNTLDLCISRPPTTAFLQVDPDGRFRFRVFERFAFREKDPSAVIRLDFQENQGDYEPKSSGRSTKSAS